MSRNSMNLFVLNDEESKRERKFKKKHPNIRYILTPTHIGVKVELECIETGTKEDITDYDRW